MKRFKKAPNGNQLSVGMIIWLLAFASISCTAGITYVVLKNEQVEVAREIRQMNKEIAACNVTAEYYDTKKAPLINRWSIKDRLAKDKSALVPIDNKNVEYITPVAPSRLASTDNN